MDTSIQYLKGVGPRRARLLSKIGISSIADVLSYYPRDWEDRRLNVDRPGSRVEGGTAVFCGTVAAAKFLQTKKSLGIFQAVIVDSSGKSVQAYWFKRSSPRYDVFAPLRRDIFPGNSVWIVGRPENSSGDSSRGLFAVPQGPASQGRVKVSVEEYYMTSDTTAAKIHVGRIIPVYPLTEGLSGKLLRDIAYKALKQFSDSVPEVIPDYLLSARRFLGISQALWGIHFPNSEPELEDARRRMVYEEFLLLSVAWAIKRRQTQTLRKGFGYEIRKNLLTPFRSNLGFDFTQAQTRVINEIFKDMQAPCPMTRLLQGDVGSGKTVVALSALLLAVENGYQGVFMAPTEILAEQHFITFRRFLKKLPVRFDILTSRVKSEARKKILKKAASGEIDILIGTHAVIEEAVAFSNLRMAVIDEQHRFGVRQRTLLRQKGNLMDLLIMTATPIPRTLSLSLYGDLDVSVLDQLPPGRLPVKTFHVGEAKAFQSAREEVSKGRQVYIVYPLIEESDTKELKSVKREFERLQKDVFKDLRVGIVHGQMSSNRKAKVMEDFLKRKLDILTATPVIEVGIDVPNASLMIIQNASQFGLASLHQLRGRIGRGEHYSNCLLVADCKTPQTAERIDLLCSTQDGFRIGEKDMQMRGPGEVLGTKQHGKLEMKIGDIVRDAGILQWAIQDKDLVLNQDPDLRQSAHGPLRDRLLELYHRKWHLIDLA